MANAFGSSATLIAVLVVQGCASPPAGPATEVLTTPCEDCVRGVPRFARISPALWRGAQPTEEGFRNLEAAGARTVISVRHDHDDADLLRGTHLRYLRIRTRAWNPKELDLETFLATVQNADNWPVFIHCQNGQDRAGFYVAAYRIIVDGWNADDAIREMYAFGYNPVWLRIPIVLRQMDVARLKADFGTPTSATRALDGTQ